MKCKCYSTEEEEEAIRRMEERKRKKMEETGDSQEEARPTKSAKPSQKKKKKDKTNIKSMTKEERQKRSEELKAQRKEKVLERKRAKTEADKVKAQLKREEHKILLEKTHALLRKHTPSAAAESATEAAASAAQPEPPQETLADVLETSLVESVGPLNLNLFPSEEEDEDEPPGVPHYRRSTVQTETVSQVITEAYIQTPTEDAPATTSRAKAAKKVPKKVPSTSRPRPGTGALNYTPCKKDIRKAQKAGDILPAGGEDP